MQQQYNSPPTCLVPNPKNPRVLVTQQAAQKIREELQAAEAASKTQGAAAPRFSTPSKQTYVAPPPKTGQSAKPKFSAPPILLRRGSAPPPLVHITEPVKDWPEGEVAVQRLGQGQGPAVVPPPTVVLPPKKSPDNTDNKNAAEKAIPSGPAATKGWAPHPGAALVRTTKQAAPVATPPKPQNPKTKKGEVLPAAAQKKGLADPEDSSVAIVPPAREDNVPDDVDAALPKGDAPFDEDLFEALLNA